MIHVKHISEFVRHGKWSIKGGDAGSTGERLQKQIKLRVLTHCSTPVRPGVEGGQLQTPVLSC